ncbi:hypothetical protein G5I_00881 [Acromyrmex echinatior]|uniref:Uncharacterized protein n=1 Tax=Acromyrmex echinatior TaxID=103372 RepID=F4W6P8_ACREC|nr:hypothetical protein G5I_00881 [Acromyrmex echinatior]
MVCVHSEKKHAIYYVIQGSRYANRTNVTIIAVRSKGTRHDCAEKGTRGLSKLSIVSFHSRLVFLVDKILDLLEWTVIGTYKNGCYISLAKREFTAHLRDRSSSLCNPTETDPDLGYPSTSTNRWMMSMASHEVEYSTTRGKRSSRLRSKRPTRLEADQLEDGFRLMKNISPADYTDSKFISCETNPSESLLKIVKLHEREIKEVIRKDREKETDLVIDRRVLHDRLTFIERLQMYWILSKGEKDRTREIEQRSRKETRRKEEKKDNKDDVAPSRGICPRKRWNSCVRRRIVSDGSCNSQESPGESERFLSSSMLGRAEEREILGWMLRV